MIVKLSSLRFNNNLNKATILLPHASFYSPQNYSFKVTQKFPLEQELDQKLFPIISQCLKMFEALWDEAKTFDSEIFFIYCR